MFSPKWKDASLVVVFLLMAVTASAQSADHKVTIEAMSFSPEPMEINLGDSVVWENKDPFPHNVTSPTGGFESPEIAPGKTWTFKPKKKGTYEYICSFHPTMKAQIIVK